MLMSLDFMIRKNLAVYRYWIFYKEQVFTAEVMDWEWVEKVWLWKIEITVEFGNFN